MTLPMVSVVVPMHNSYGYIALCLESILRMDYPAEKMEVIVVNNGSTDGSRERAARYPVRVIDCPVGNISRVRNCGAEHAKGVILGFVDSDCVVASDWIRSAIVEFEDSSVAATGSGYRLPENPSWVERAWLLESTIERRYVRFIPSGNFVVRARSFRAVGGFDENLVTCEDSDICERLADAGFQITNATRIANVHLRNPKSIAGFFLKELWYGKHDRVPLRVASIDRVFLGSLVFGIGHLMVLAGVWSERLMGVGAFLILGVVVGAALRRIAISKKYSLLPQTIALYYCYFAARLLGKVIQVVKGSPKAVSGGQGRERIAR